MNSYPAFEVGIPFSLFEKGEKAVQEAYGREDNTNDVEEQGFPGLVKKPPGSIPILPESVSLRPEEVPGPSTVGEDADWFPEDATINVWSTDSDEPSEFLVAALHENGIHCRVDQQGTSAKLYVLPHDASRAREIIREIVEATPPSE